MQRPKKYGTMMSLRWSRRFTMMTLGNDWLMTFAKTHDL